MAMVLLMIESRRQWRIVSCADPDQMRVLPMDTTPRQLAESALELVADKRASIMLAVRSDQVMTAKLSPASDRVAGDREAMLFQLEEELPVRAEQLAADFMTSESSTLGVAIDASRYRPIVEAFDALGMRVTGIAPTATLIASELAPDVERDIDFLLFGNEDGCDLVQLNDRQPVNWWFENSVDNAFATELTVVTLPFERSFKLLNYSSATPPPAPNIAIETGKSDATDLQLLIRATGRITSGTSPWFDLRRGPLIVGDPHREIRWPLKVLVASLLLLMFSIGAALFIRAGQFETEMAELHDSQRQLIAEVLPNQKIPAGGILSRLKSHVKTMRGAREKAQNVELSQSSVLILQHFMQAMSNASNFEVRNASVENGELDVDVVVNSFAAVNELMGTLQQHGFEMSPPSSEQNGGVVVARLVGKYLPAQKISQAASSPTEAVR